MFLVLVEEGRTVFSAKTTCEYAFHDNKLRLCESGASYKVKITYNCFKLLQHNIRIKGVSCLTEETLWKKWK